MTKPAVTSFLVAQKMMKKRIDKIEKLDLNFDQGSTDVSLTEFVFWQSLK